MIAVSVLCAVLAAASNAAGTVLQRRAAMTVPASSAMRVRLMTDLLRRPIWLGGILCVILSFLFQASALATGPLAMVQPIFVLELPFALTMATRAFGKPLPRNVWLAVFCIVAGLGIALGAAAPGGGAKQAPMTLWIAVLVCCGAAMGGLVAAAVRRPNGPVRAACLGTATAIGYALTAALMKSATDYLDVGGLRSFFTCWQTYGFAVVGVVSLFLLENAMQSGPLIASQPALTLGDALISLSLGVTLYDEGVRAGWWLLPELAGVALVAVGVSRLSRVEVLSVAVGQEELAARRTLTQRRSRAEAGDEPAAAEPAPDEPAPDDRVH